MLSAIFQRRGKVSNSWTKLVLTTDPKPDSEGVLASDSHCAFQRPEETIFKIESANQWLEETDDDSRYNMQSLEEIAQESLTRETHQEIASEGHADITLQPRSSLALSYLDTMDLPNPDTQHDCQHSRK